MQTDFSSPHLSINAAFTLACAFPPRRGGKGACTTIADLRFAKPDPLLCPRGRKDAVHLIVAANYARALAYGKGLKAAKRAAKAQEYVPLLVASINRENARRREKTASLAISEQVPEGRTVNHLHRVNFHE